MEYKRVNFLKNLKWILAVFEGVTQMWPNLDEYCFEIFKAPQTVFQITKCKLLVWDLLSNTITRRRKKRVQGIYSFNYVSPKLQHEVLTAAN